MDYMTTCIIAYSWSPMPEERPTLDIKCSQLVKQESNMFLSQVGSLTSDELCKVTIEGDVDYCFADNWKVGIW